MAATLSRHAYEGDYEMNYWTCTEFRDWVQWDWAGRLSHRAGNCDASGHRQLGGAWLSYCHTTAGFSKHTILWKRQTELKILH